MQMPKFVWVLKGIMVPGAGIEPAQPLGPRDFKSLASTYSATRAFHNLLAILISECGKDFKEKGGLIRIFKTLFVEDL